MQRCLWLDFQKTPGSHSHLLQERKLHQRETLEMPLKEETSETFTGEAVIFRESAGNLFHTAKSQLLGHDFICVIALCDLLQTPSVQLHCLPRLGCKWQCGF